MDWTRRDTLIHTATVTVEFTTTYGAKRACTVDFRVDGRDGTFRVDKRSIGPWEAIDGGTGFKTATEAKRHARAYHAACSAQSTLAPRMERV